MDNFYITLAAFCAARDVESQHLCDGASLAAQSWVAVLPRAFVEGH